ncbi:hypothetical protein ASPFODRAFT_48020 [Aspergillus luchuensis CBS 106.47]|uniref:Uncharacterized protein n=1 Tax=Aspergillus luchuensis (strain CBS 106.47) TaxID=1137211 RepID=A0A1M3TFB2_ASPLC|nr:hypothetical protein ASPFODRAFT_48020 [Aspergillus luchuensis CBS 106.47]
MKVLVATEALTAAATAVLVVLTAVLAVPVALTEAPAVSKALTDYNLSTADDRFVQPFERSH